MTLESSPVQARTVFRQDTAPKDTEALWLDTNTDPATLKIYDSSSGTWKAVASSTLDGTTETVNRSTGTQYTNNLNNSVHYGIDYYADVAAGGTEKTSLTINGNYLQHTLTNPTGAQLRVSDTFSFTLAPGDTWELTTNTTSGIQNAIRTELIPK